MAQILTATIHVRVTPEEKEKFQDAANNAAQSLGEWVRKALLIAAQPAKPSEPGEGVLGMDKGKYVPILPDGLAEAFKHGTVISPVLIEPERFNNPLPAQLPVIAPPATGAQPTGAQPIPVPVVTPARPMSMVDRMYAIIEARDGKEKADFWLATSTGRQIKK